MKSGKRQQNSEESLRARVITEASQEFIKKGIKSVRMDDIAALLSISKRTLYEIFNDKEELLYDCVIHLHNEKKRKIEGVIKGADNIMEIVLRSFQFHINMFKTISPDFIFEVRKYSRIQQYIANERDLNSQKVVEFFQKGVEQGFFRSDINYELLVDWSRYQGDFMSMSDIYQKFPLEEIFKTMMYVNMRGISTEKGLKILNDFKKQNDKR